MGGISVLVLFVIFAGIGLYEAGQHHGRGPTAVSFDVKVQGNGMSPSTISVHQDDQVVLSLSSDRDQSISIPGYGLSFSLTSVAAVSATFVATKAGSFDIVLDRTSAKIGVLKVT